MGVAIVYRIITQRHFRFDSRHDKRNEQAELKGDLQKYSFAGRIVLLALFFALSLLSSSTARWGESFPFVPASTEKISLEKPIMSGRRWV